jgi:ankyrin repeat protein
MGKYQALFTVLFVVLVAFLVWWRAWDDFLVWAVNDDDESIVKALLATGAKVDAVYIRGQTALYQAAQKGNLGIVKLLVSRGAKVNSVDKDGGTPLSVAAYHGHTEVVRTLLAAGADPSLVDHEGKRALDQVPKDKPELEKLLKEAVPPRPRAEAEQR